MSEDNQTLDPATQDTKATDAPVTETAGFAAAAAPLEETETAKSQDRLAMQFALDAKASPYSQKMSLGPVTPGSYDTSGYKYNPIRFVQPALQDSPDTAPAAPLAPVAEEILPVTISEEDNKTCLTRLATVFELDNMRHTALLRNLALVQDHQGQYALPDDRDAAVVKTTTNIALVAKGLIAFQEEGHVKASDALEGAVLVLNDKASYPHGVELTGNIRDRYMLMLAAQKVNLTVANPVDIADLDAETRHDIEAEFCLHLVMNNEAMTAFTAEAEAAPTSDTLTEADTGRVNDLVSGKTTPQQPAPKTPAPAMA